MNIYLCKINDIPDWLVAAENLPEALAQVAKGIVNWPEDSDYQALAEDKDLKMNFKLVAKNTTLDAFEKIHPEEYDDYF